MQHSCIFFPVTGLAMYIIPATSDGADRATGGVLMHPCCSWQPVMAVPSAAAVIVVLHCLLWLLQVPKVELGEGTEWAFEIHSEASPEPTRWLGSRQPCL